ncbi:N-acetylmuramoyl-L-alanine amidase, partial [Candidatus Dojkabacteria bacterium]|nr:N-acetylmuramoyl-L-alanine amidase [Candidatus Dojkabacteria bacterium]
MPRVIVSSGHTSKSPGTVANGLKEVDLARKIAKATLPHLRQNGVITLSVPPDMDLFQRLEWINKTGYDENTGDIAIEIHINDGGDSGVEAWYEGEGDTESKRLTETLLQEVTAESGLTNKGSKSEYDHDLGSIAFLHEVHPVASLIECGYIDNEKDAEFLKDDNNIAKLGKGIAKGILKYLNIEYREAQMPANNNQQPQTNQNQSTAKPAAKPRIRPAGNNSTMPPVSAVGNSGGDGNNSIPVPNNAGLGNPMAGLGNPGGMGGFGAGGAG